MDRDPSKNVDPDRQRVHSESVLARIIGIYTLRAKVAGLASSTILASFCGSERLAVQVNADAFRFTGSMELETFL